ncbi:MAG TPA: alpha/beta hydrolase [Pirellulales bacterium]|nr:alpha/beta hydrolase [Pirellulales bacterium]
MKRPKTWLCVSLVLVLAGGLGAHLVQTDCGAIDVVGLTFPTENGQWVTADLFKPTSATAANRVPLVVVCPGFERSKETMGSYSIELARRGIAVITIDPYNQGASSSTSQRRSATKEGYGVVPVVEYVHDTPNLNYIDKSRIGAAGYSAGGNAVLRSAAQFGERQAQALRRANRKDSEGGRSITDTERAATQSHNKLAAIFVGGYILTMTDEVLATVDANVGLDYASYDEGAYRAESGHADLRTAPEALRLVNSVLPRGESISTVQIGQPYGDAAGRTLRIVHNTPNIHPLLPYDKRFVEHLVEFFTVAFGLEPTIAPANQTWLCKELLTLMALVGAMLFIAPCAALLLQLPLFRSLVHPVPPALPRPRGKRRLIFWFNFALSALLACFLFIPLADATAILFPQASAVRQTWWFPQRINNAILLWAVANGLIGLAIFTLTYQLSGKKHGVTSDMWGLRIGARELGKTFVLSLLVLGAFYLLLFGSYAIFHTDFRFAFVAASTAFPVKMLWVALEYLPLFFVFYLANSIRVNAGSRFEGQREWVNMLINALGNTLGLVAILVIQYGTLALTRRPFWTEGWLYVNLLLGVIPMMFILPYFNRCFFRMSGRVWLGPMVTCLVFVMMLLTSNVCYIPLK